MSRSILRHTFHRTRFSSYVSLSTICILSSVIDPSDLVLFPRTVLVDARSFDRARTARSPWRSPCGHLIRSLFELDTALGRGLIAQDVPRPPHKHHSRTLPERPIDQPRLKSQPRFSFIIKLS